MESVEALTGAALAPCTGCGWTVAGGTAGCQAVMDRALARDFGDVRYFRVHRMLVDTYCLQHPERYCASAKSFAAHLVGLCWLIDHAGDPMRGHEALRRWLDGRIDLERPQPPADRGRLTIGDVWNADDPRAHAAAVERWARSTWDAYAPLHALARGWMTGAFAR